MSGCPIQRKVNVLLVEDCAVDVELTVLALADANLRVNLTVVPDGVEAMAYLRRQGGYADAVTPDVLLLDLEMPRMNGWQVLDEIRKDPDLGQLPVVILTGSNAQTDVEQAYDNHANAFVTKPLDRAEFAEAIRSIDDFWFQLAMLPDPSVQGEPA